MAHQREKEETELKLPKTISVCVPTIPVSPQLSGADDQTQVASSSAGGSARSAESSDPKVSDADDSRSGAARSLERSDPVGSPPKRPEAEAVNHRPLKRPREVNRCSGNGCRRKVGLIGFRCRCGEVFCSEHRYSDRHDCTFDYKAAGREAIARENPVVRAAKILKV